MTKYLHDLPEHVSLWGHEEVLDNDLERLEHDRNFESSDVYNSILDDEPAYHSLMNFPEDDDELQAEGYDDSTDTVFDDRDAYKNTDNDDFFYFI